MLVSRVDVGDGKVGQCFLKVFIVSSSPLLVQLIYRVTACNSKGLMVSSEVAYYLFSGISIVNAPLCDHRTTELQSEENIHLRDISFLYLLV